MMRIDFFGPRYPACESEYRLFVDNGEDEDVPVMDYLDTIYDRPSKQLVLHPGGTVTSSARLSFPLR